MTRLSSAESALFLRYVQRDSYHRERQEKGHSVAVELSTNLKQYLDKPIFVTVATIQPDGSPQVSPVWIKRDGNDLLFSTTVGRRKEKNLQRDHRVSVVVQDFDAPYNYAEIRGEATVTAEGGPELIDELAMKYTGKKYAEFNPAAVHDNPRVVVRISPRKVVGMGNLT